LFKKKFNQVNKSGLDISEGEIKRQGVPADFSTEVNIGEGAVGC
jgi:hypothetical protein